MTSTFCKSGHSLYIMKAKDFASSLKNESILIVSDPQFSCWFVIITEENIMNWNIHFFLVSGNQSPKRICMIHLLEWNSREDKQIHI
jgi:hypothetical protein